MRLYIVQHGKAKSKEDDPDRPLTEDGITETNNIAVQLKMWMKPTMIYHSGKLRAKQTAELMQGHLGDPDLTAIDYIDPMDDPRVFVDRVNNMDEDIMVVGHLPFLSKLIGLMTMGSADNEPLKVTNSAITCLEKVEEGWQIAWSLPVMMTT